MKITVIGGGPGGLYFSILLKKAVPSCTIDLYERNKSDDAFGFGVVFSDETLSEFLTRDPLEALTRSPYAYVHGNPLNATDPTGLCGPFGDEPCPGASAARAVGGIVIDGATEATRFTPHGLVTDVASRATGKTLGFCIGASGSAVLAVNGSLCYVSTPSGEAGFTGTLGYGLSSSTGASLLAGPTISNAQSLSDLRGAFSYREVFASRGSWGANLAYGYGSNQCGDDIWQVTPSITRSSEWVPSYPLGMEYGQSWTWAGGHG